ISSFGADLDVVASTQIAPGLVIALDVNGLVFSVGEPALDTSRETVLLMDDAAGPLSTVGTPNNTGAAPLRSLWQTDSIGMRLVLPTSWATRVPVSWLTATAW